MILFFHKKMVIIFDLGAKDLANYLKDKNYLSQHWITHIKNAGRLGFMGGGGGSLHRSTNLVRDTNSTSNHLETINYTYLHCKIFH